jgi:hypothetical protein
MRILLLNTDYQRCHAWLYRRHPGLENAPYAVQMAARNSSVFGLANFYSKNFAALGHQSQKVYVNNRRIQPAWAHEHGMEIEPPGPLPAFERNSVISRSNRPSLMPCRLRLRRTSTPLLSGLSRWTTKSASRCSKPSPNVTI